MGGRGGYAKEESLCNHCNEEENYGIKELVVDQELSIIVFIGSVCQGRHGPLPLVYVAQIVSFCSVNLFVFLICNFKYVVWFN
jgi:hypothetical protein